MNIERKVVVGFEGTRAGWYAKGTFNRALLRAAQNGAKWIALTSGGDAASRYCCPFASPAASSTVEA
jgi:hypothetical protein